MIFFITFLRALAACLITNSHYTDIYPTNLLANGGMLGDVLFFAVSGFCLYHVKYELSGKGFACWYGKRIWRLYPPVLIMTALYMLLGAYSLETHNALWWYVFPTYYHFVASIILLYIPYFFIMKIPALRERIPLIMAGIAVLWLAVYFVWYDKSYYHIDTVREPMVRFLFMESLLLGAQFRRMDARWRNAFRVTDAVLAVLSFAVYMALKLLFSRHPGYSAFQFVNQIAVFVVLFFVFRTFCGLDAKLEKLPAWLKKGIRFISDMTLEIYVVQYVLVRIARASGIVFPLNWLLLTASILLSAFLLHRLCALLYRYTDKWIEKNRARKKEVSS